MCAVCWLQRGGHAPSYMHMAMRYCTLKSNLQRGEGQRLYHVACNWLATTIAYPLFNDKCISVAIRRQYHLCNGVSQYVGAIILRQSNRKGVLHGISGDGATQMECCSAAIGVLNHANGVLKVRLKIGKVNGFGLFDAVYI